MFDTGYTSIEILLEEGLFAVLFLVLRELFIGREDILRYRGGFVIIDK